MDPQRAGLSFPLLLGGQPVWVVERCSSAGFATCEPGQSGAAETCNASHRQLPHTGENTEVF